MSESAALNEAANNRMLRAQHIAAQVNIPLLLQNFPYNFLPGQCNCTGERPFAKHNRRQARLQPYQGPG